MRTQYPVEYGLLTNWHSFLIFHIKCGASGRQQAGVHCTLGPNLIGGRVKTAEWVQRLTHLSLTFKKV